MHLEIWHSDISPSSYLSLVLTCPILFYLVLYTGICVLVKYAWWESMYVSSIVGETFCRHVQAVWLRPSHTIRRIAQHSIFIFGTCMVRIFRGNSSQVPEILVPPQHYNNRLYSLALFLFYFTKTTYDGRYAEHLANKNDSILCVLPRRKYV